MAKVKLVFLRSGRTKARPDVEINLPGVPQPGDTIVIEEGGPTGANQFTVRKTSTCWRLRLPAGKTGAATAEPITEVECVAVLPKGAPSKTGKPSASGGMGRVIPG